MSLEFNEREKKLENLLNWQKNEDIISIVDAMKDNDPVVRAEAILLIGKLGRQDYVNSVIDALNDLDHHVRFCAAESLGVLKTDNVLQPLINTAMNNSEFVRCRAINAIGKLHNPESIDFLIGMLSDSSENINEEAALALENLLDETLCQNKLAEYFDNDFLRQKKFKALFKMLQFQTGSKRVL